MYIHIYIYVYMYTCIYAYILKSHIRPTIRRIVATQLNEFHPRCVCVCVCVCARAPVCVNTAKHVFGCLYLIHRFSEGIQLWSFSDA